MASAFYVLDCNLLYTGGVGNNWCFFQDLPLYIPVGFAFVGFRRWNQPNRYNSLFLHDPHISIFQGVLRFVHNKYINMSVMVLHISAKIWIEGVVPIGVKVVLKSKGRIWLPKKTMRGGARIYIPSEIVLDSTFPFQTDGEILVEIDRENKTVKLRPMEST